MYNITINKSTTLPLFQQIKEDISSKIKNGEYVSGHKIPTELELIEQYNVSRITVRRAIDELCKEGALVKKQGKGTFVQEKRIFRKIEHTTSFSDSCCMNGMIPSAIVNKRKVLTSDSKDIPNLPDFKYDSAVYIQRVRTADDIPVLLENNFFPYSRYSFLLTEPLLGSLYELLSQKGINIGCSHNSYIDALKATTEQAFLLDISPGDPVFYLYTELYDDHNQLVYVGKQIIAAARYRFSYENS